MNDPHFDFRHMNVNHLRLPIKAIHLCINFTPQGICDEQYELSVMPVPRQRSQVGKLDPPRANHFSLWFGFDGDEAVMLDVTQVILPSNPYASNVVETRSLPAIVRFASKKIPTDDDMGCVLREPNVPAGTTIEDIVRLIVAKGRHRYCFLPVYKQQVGCRYWIQVISQDFEDAGIAGKGFTNDVLDFLPAYYNRSQYKAPSGRWEKAGNWGPRIEFQCAPMLRGVFY